ncbi:hypothetical protein GBF38_000396, partial [Nibea albiflora]
AADCEGLQASSRSSRVRFTETGTRSHIGEQQQLAVSRTSVKE